MRVRRPRLARRFVSYGQIAAAAALIALAGCIPSADAGRAARSTLIIGIDVGGSLADDGQYESSIDFAANYLYGHLRGLGGLGRPTSIFVGAIGGAPGAATPGFQPMETFEEMSVAQIAAHLRREYPVGERTTGFNPFFERVAGLVTREGLTLVPLNVVLLTDGRPVAPAGNADSTASYATIDVSTLEYLARSVTVRVLYPSPSVALRWEQQVPRRRVRMVTVQDSVMATWERQHRAGLAPEQQLLLWKWIADNIDVPVRSASIL